MGVQAGINHDLTLEGLASSKDRVMSVRERINHDLIIQFLSIIVF